MLPEVYSPYYLTQEQRDNFEDLGFLIINNALPTEMVERLLKAIDKLWVEHQQSSKLPFLHLMGFIGKDPSFVELLNWPTTFPLVWGLLGWNIFLYHSHLDVNPPENREWSKGKLSWHQDSGRVNSEIETCSRPRLSLKVSYWLSDVSEPGRGNMFVIPGSHKRDTYLLDNDESKAPSEAIPILAKPGTAVLFDRRLWHTRSPNYSGLTRKALFYGYSYRWLRARDELVVSPQLLVGCDAIQHQLLQRHMDADGYIPSDRDVPLRNWLLQHYPNNID